MLLHSSAANVEYFKSPSSQRSTKEVWHTPHKQADLEGFAQHLYPGSVIGALSLFIISLRAEMSGRSDGLLTGWTSEEISLHSLVAKMASKQNF